MRALWVVLTVFVFVLVLRSSLGPAMETCTRLDLEQGVSHVSCTVKKVDHWESKLFSPYYQYKHVQGFVSENGVLWSNPSLRDPAVGDAGNRFPATAIGDAFVLSSVVNGGQYLIRYSPTSIEEVHFFPGDVFMESLLFDEPIFYYRRDLKLYSYDVQKEVTEELRDFSDVERDEFYWMIYSSSMRPEEGVHVFSFQIHDPDGNRGLYEYTVETRDLKRVSGMPDRHPSVRSPSPFKTCKRASDFGLEYPTRPWFDIHEKVFFPWRMFTGAPLYSERC